MSKNGRIAKNTGFLYLRSLFILLINLYTSRVVLSTLGVDDYGLFSVIGGVIGMLGFVNQTMQSTYQRYLNVEMGKGNDQGVTKMFSHSISSQVLIAIVVLLLAETIGIWFVSEKLVIPEGREDAAMWVYQAAVWSFILVFMSVPFGAAITAYEKMGVFALISIVDAVLRLVIIFVVKSMSGDSLINYSYLLLLVGALNLVCYMGYCIVKFPLLRMKFGQNKDDLMNMLSFSGWSLCGTLAQTLKSQGLNLVLNLFWGTAVNAARGISMQILGGVNQFVHSFQTSFRPQLTKSYASGDYDYMTKLYYSATKISFFLIMTISMPVLFETDQLLYLWLGDNVPKYTASFTRLVLMTATVSAFANPTSCIAYATGKIKWFTICVSGINLLILPLAYLVLRLGYNPNSALWVSLIMTILVQVVRIIVVSKMTVLKLADYFLSVVCPLFLYAVVAVVVPFLIINSMEESFSRLVLVCFLSVLSSLLSNFFIGLNDRERMFVKNKLKIACQKISGRI